MSDLAAAPPASPSSSGSARVDEFREAVQRLRLRSTGRTNEPEYYLFVVGAVLVPLGILTIILGWNGAARTPNSFEQIPYMISGGLLGVALTFAGGFAYFGYFIARLVTSSKAQNDRTLEALSRLEELLAGTIDPDGTGAVPAPAAAPGPTAPVSHEPDAAAPAVEAPVASGPETGPSQTGEPEAAEAEGAEAEGAQATDRPPTGPGANGRPRRPSPRPVPGAKRVRRRAPLSAD